MPVFAGLLLIALVCVIPLAKPLNLLLLGETYAESMGLNLRWVRVGVLAMTALLAGTVTAFCGPVGFLGIAGPHVTRMLMRRTDHRSLLPGSMLLGGLLAICAALIADLPGSNLVLPLNAVTALMGAPVVVMILLRQKSS
jgi:iron complex transport system permease protein